MKNHMIERVYPADEMPAYVQKLVVSGNCKAMLRAGCFEDDGGMLHFCFDCSGASAMADELRNRDTILLDQYKRLLKMMEKICAALIEAQSYLIPQEYLELDLDSIFFFSQPYRAALLPADPGRYADNKDAGPGSRLTDLLEAAERAFPGLGADVAARRLEQEASLSIPDPARMRSLFALWLSEIS